MQGVVTLYTTVDSSATGIKIDGYFGYYERAQLKACVLERAHVCMELDRIKTL